MINSLINSEITSIVRSAIESHGKKHDALIPILSDVNNKLGYIPNKVFREICKQLYNPAEQMYVAESQLYTLASFYDMISTKQRGENVIKFCENAPCHVVGGKAIWDALKEQLNLNDGETTPDSKWTLVTTSCLGLCSVGPVLLINDDMYGNVTPDQIQEILGRYDKGMS